jgi:RimJ/RimL family protein N-acetyltransferase
MSNRPNSQDDSRGAFMVNLVVEKGWRGRHLGTDIAKYLIAFATSLGSERIYAEVESQNLVRHLT